MAIKVVVETRNLEGSYVIINNIELFDNSLVKDSYLSNVTIVSKTLESSVGWKSSSTNMKAIGLCDKGQTDLLPPVTEVDFSKSNTFRWGQARN